MAEEEKVAANFQEMRLAPIAAPIDSPDPPPPMAPPGPPAPPVPNIGPEVLAIFHQVIQQGKNLKADKYFSFLHSQVVRYVV